MVIDTQHEIRPPQGRPFSILVADDDAGSREALSGLLENRGFNTIQAGNGAEAVEIVRVEVIHLIFFDMHMPKLTGLEAWEQVRLINALLPAILVTADATQELIRQAFEAQVYSVIPKPVNKNVVLQTLSRALHEVYGPPKPPGQPNAN